MRKSTQQISHIYETTIKTPLGTMLAKADDEGVLHLDFVDEIAEINKKENRILKALVKQLDEYFLKKQKNFTLPLSLKGSEFQKNVWQTLMKIPYGKTISYKEEAQQINNPKAYRAVANANGKNPISIIIPCHRVIQNSGKLGGYTGGVWRKEFLLELEGVRFLKIS